MRALVIAAAMLAVSAPAASADTSYGGSALVKSSLAAPYIGLVRHDDGRELLIEAEISRTGRNRVLVNRQRLARTRELLGVIRVSVLETPLSPSSPAKMYTLPSCTADAW